MKTVYLILAAGICFAPRLDAQHPGAAHLTAVNGNDFTITSGGQEQQFSAQQLRGKSIYFNLGDSAQTGPGSYMDITLIPGGPDLRLAENTSIVLNGVHPNKSSAAITLVYGRILVKAGKHGSPLFVQTGASAAEIETGVINIDYTVLPFVQPPGRPAMLVSSLSGSAVVWPRYTSPDIGRIIVRKGDSIYIDSLLNSVDRVKADKAIAEYWNKRQTVYPSKYDPEIKIVPQSAGQAGQTGQVDDEIEYTQGNPNEKLYIVPYKADRVDSKVRSAGIITGLVLMVVGVAAQGAMHFMESTYIDKRQSDIIFYSGFAPIGIGAFVLAASSTYKPRESMPIPALDQRIEPRR